MQSLSIPSLCVTFIIILFQGQGQSRHVTNQVANNTNDVTIEAEKRRGVRLLGGQVEGTGNVLLFHNEQWGLLCDDGWDLNGANVICRQLGFPYALGHTTNAYFGKHKYGIILDDVRCHGDEDNITLCRNSGWTIHDCTPQEAAGVFCAPRSMARPTTTTTTTMAPTSSTRIPNLMHEKAKLMAARLKEEGFLGDEAKTAEGEEEHHHSNHINQVPEADVVRGHPNRGEKYQIRLANGRNPEEGRVEIKLKGHEWGVICSDRWTLLEAMVVCRQLGLGYAQMNVKVPFEQWRPQGEVFAGLDLVKVASGVTCDGEEESLDKCFHHALGNDVVCPERQMIAGVICTTKLPDLVPNATLIQQSTYLVDRPLLYMQCAMEEGCAAEKAYTVINSYPDWFQHRRRLLRFSSSVWNFGTIDFRPELPKNHWEWHDCHMHYHSMAVFAHYDILDDHGNRVAEGHKASFCLEDVQCLPGIQKKYACRGFSDQGISPGCADDYLHDIDCQWVDITELKPGNYKFQVHVNPEYRVAELNFHNNAATCAMEYTGYQVYLRNCTTGRA